MARILVVDDESDILALNKRRFEAQGYEVMTAASVRQAKAAIEEWPPDLILLDVLLPDGSGFDFCRELRSATTAPILYLTCVDSDSGIIHGLTEGGDDYMTKPYNLDVLSARVHALLRRSERSGVGRVSLPPLEIDLVTGRARLNGEDLLLSPKELQLLAYLASNVGRGFSADELYKAVWGDASDVPTTVKVHISKLRKKLNLDGVSPFDLTLTANHEYMLLKIRY